MMLHSLQKSLRINLKQSLYKFYLYLLKLLFSSFFILTCNVKSDEVPDYKAKRCFNILYILYNHNKSKNIDSEIALQDLTLLSLYCRETVGKREKEREKNRFGIEDIPGIKR
jgi:hypothetical protein